MCNFTYHKIRLKQNSLFTIKELFDVTLKPIENKNLFVEKNINLFKIFITFINVNKYYNIEIKNKMKKLHSYQLYYVKMG